MPKIVKKAEPRRPKNANPKRARPKPTKSRPFRQNPPSVAPILRLPPEILCEIFAIIKKGSYKGFYDMGWIRVTHICRHWREIAFTSPSLWASNFWPFKNPSWLKQILIRSKEAPLSVVGYVHYVGRQSLPGFLLLLDQIQRIKLMAIEVEAEDWQLVRSKLPRCAPLLERLVLNSSMHSDLPLMKLFGPEEPLYELPKLRHLELRWFNINWDTFALFPGIRALTHLRLGRNTFPTWQQLLSILKELLDLEGLDLEYSLPDSESDSHVSGGSHPLHLTSLRSLTLSDKGRAIETLLAQIDFPTSTIVEIVTNEVELDSLSRLFSQLSHSLTGSSLQSLIISQDDDNDEDVRLTLYHEIINGNEMLDRLSFVPRLTLRFQDLIMYHRMRTSAKQADIKINRIIFHSPLLRNVNCVYLKRVPTSFSPDAFAYTLGELKTVRSIVAKGLAADAFVKAMNFGSYGALNTDPAQPPVISLYFPNLSSVCLFQADFSLPPTPHGIQKGARSPKSVPIMRQLQACLAHRQEWGAKLEQLTLRLCHRIFEDDVVALKAKVSAVEWDHKDIVPDDSSSESEEIYSEDNIWNRRRRFARDDEEEDSEEYEEEYEDSEEEWGRQMTSDEEADLAYM